MKINIQCASYVLIKKNVKKNYIPNAISSFLLDE